MRIATLLLLSITASAAAQSDGAGRPMITLSAGLSAPVRHFTSGAPDGRAIGAAYSFAIGWLPTRMLVAPRIRGSYQTAPDPSGLAETGRVELEAATAPRRRGSVVPYAAAGIGAYRDWFNWCGTAGRSATCAGDRSGVGWQLGLGVIFPSRNGAGASFDVRYLADGRAFDAFTFTLGLSL